MRSKDSAKNLIYGLIGFVVSALFGIIIPRLFLVSYGSEVNGLIGSVKQLYSYLALLEAGIGGATLQALYKPMAERDYKGVSAILSASNSFYKKTGIFYAVLVFILAGIYPIVVHSDISKIVIVCVIIFQGEAGALRYLVSGKLQLLLEVDGKSYILSNVHTIITIVSDLLRILLLLAGANVIFVQAVFCVVDICQVFYIVLYTKKHYAWLDLKERPDYKAVAQKNSVFVHQISGLIFNSTDTIVLTIFCGLKSVSVYGLYTLIFGVVSTIISTLSGSVKSAMGQLFHCDRKRFSELQEAYETYYIAFCYALFSIAYIFILPFFRLYTNGITDANYLDPNLPVLFILYETLNYGRVTSNSIIGFAGHFSQTKKRAIAESIINLSLSLLAVQFWDIYGVLIGTIVALLYRTNDIILYANTVIMSRSAWPTYRRWLLNIGLMLLCCWLGSHLPQSYPNYLILFGYGIVVGTAVIAVFLIVNSIVEKAARITAFSYICPMIQNILPRKN